VNVLVKNTIWVRVFFFAVVPIAIICSIVSVFVGRSVRQDKIRQADIDVITLARFNETSLQGCIENVRLTIKIAVVRLENLDPHIQDAREAAENVLLSCFENRRIYNAWFAFEPNAFGGRDAEHPDEYPGAPSGRFIRSFVRDEGGSILPVPNRDETIIDDPDECYWYTILKQSGQPYIDINMPGDQCNDYSFGEKTIPISIVFPIFRDNVFIGCVGGDFPLHDVILGPELISGTMSALLTNSGVVYYDQNIDFIGKNIEELGFPHPDKIRKFFSAQTDFFLRNEYSGFLKEKAYSYFMPVRLTDFNETVYIHAAISTRMITEAMYSFFMPIGVVFVIALIFFTSLLFYLAKSISRPIRELTAASEAISQGDFNRKIAISYSRGEIGSMTRSLHRMVDQFQMYITLLERSKELLDIYTRLYEALYRQNSVEDVFESAIFIIADYFKITNASLIILKDDVARFMARYTAEKGLWKTITENDAVAFEYHNQAAALLAGRKYLYLNAAAITEQQVLFTAEDTTSLCILPVRTGEILRGYFLLEGNKTTDPLVHYDDALIFISGTISYILTQKEGVSFMAEPAGIPARPELQEDYPPVPSEPEAAEPPVELPVVQAARSVEGLDVDRGLSLIGGMEDQYGELLRISVKVFTEGIRKMRSQYISDLPGFAIEVHGMKSALYNIGANELGDAAKKLEFAAKGGDAGFCREEYPAFEERLAALTGSLTAVTRSGIGEGGMGSIPELTAALEKVLEACRKYDAILAGRIVAPFTGFTWESEIICAEVKAVAEALENIDYDEAEVLINVLLEKIQKSENGLREPDSGFHNLDRGTET
jgi:HAMP domain-containing protein/HPt (histidine-containing phosphotransfer) domain-containing protein